MRVTLLLFALCSPSAQADVPPSAPVAAPFDLVAAYEPVRAALAEEIGRAHV